MSTGEELALNAMKKDFTRLSRIADKAKREADECMSVGSEMIAIHNEFVDIVKSGEHGEHIIKKLDVLKKRSARTEKIRKKDLVKLFDKEYETASDRDSLGSEIKMIEFRLSVRKAS